MASRHFSAKHYLDIYPTKLGMAERGTTHSTPEFIIFMRGFVNALATLDPDTPVRLEALPGRARFTNGTTGMLIGEVELSDV